MGRPSATLRRTNQLLLMHMFLPNGSSPFHSTLLQETTSQELRVETPILWDPPLTKEVDMKLSDASIRKAKPESKPVKMFDGKGLYLQVNPNGSKLWRIVYRFNNQTKTYYLGMFPDISLSMAREELRELKTKLAKGIDPGQEKQETARRIKVEQEAAQTTFKVVAQDWMKTYSRKVLPKQISKIDRMLEKYLYPAYGDVDVKDLKPFHILSPAKMKEAQGRIHTAHRLVSLAAQVLDHAYVLGHVEMNPARMGLNKKLNPERVKHHASITNPKEIGELLCDIDDYHGYIVIKYFLQIMPYVFTRCGELRGAKWAEFDLFEHELWVVPKVRMKVKEEDHKVPLAPQAIKLLLELRKITGDGEFVFPTARSRTRSISDAGPLNALRRMGYDKETMTVHGFRSTASTCLNELGYPRDHIEKQLAHKDEDEVRAAYNRAEYFDQRRKMLNEWADYLDKLKSEARARRSNLKENRESRIAAEFA